MKGAASMSKKRIIRENNFFNEESGDIIDKVIKEVERTEEVKMAINLNDVAEYYHKKLYDNEKAIGFLESLGIKNKELYSRLEIRNFADGGLLNVIGGGTRREN